MITGYIINKPKKALRHLLNKPSVLGRTKAKKAKGEAIIISVKAMSLNTKTAKAESAAIAALSKAGSNKKIRPVAKVPSNANARRVNFAS